MKSNTGEFSLNTYSYDETDSDYLDTENENGGPEKFGLIERMDTLES